MSDERFNELLNSPERWFTVAEQHLSAASVLWDALVEASTGKNSEDKDRRGVACLRGYNLMLAVSAENAIKAVLVHQGKHRKANGQINRKMFRRHPLVVLSNRAGIVIEDDDETLLNKMTEYAEWAGRFSLPLDSERHQAAIDSNLFRAGVHEMEWLHGFLARLKPIAGWDPVRMEWPFIESNV